MLNVLWTAKQLCIQPATANIRILKETLGAVSGFSLWFFVKRKKKKWGHGKWTTMVVCFEFSAT